MRGRVDKDVTMRLASWLAFLCLATAAVGIAGCKSMSAADEKYELGKDPDKVRDLSLGERAVRSFRVAIGRGPDETIARKAYQDGERLFHEGKLAEAEKQFSTAAVRWPDSALEEDALFMKGECQFFTHKYSKAIGTYQSMLKDYENTRHIGVISSRQFLVARYWEDAARTYPAAMWPNMIDPKLPTFDPNGNALSCYQSIRLKDPTGPLADDSLMATAGNFFSAGKFQDADYYYDLLRKDYPRSEHQPMAHLLGVQAKLNSYQGPLYEGSNLDEAQKLARSSLTQFPTELGEERKSLVSVQDQVYEEKARREFQMAEYYLKSKHYRAARYYFDAVIEQYPDSQYAVSARQQMQGLEGYPDVAPNHLAIVAKPFELLSR